MRTRIDYLADKYCFTERNESPRLRQQWQDVLEECWQTEAGPEERLRIA
ncbi:DNA-binding protein, partial [Escherichia coli]|nr:DNA-binding protein [Escherichia coli]EJM7319693.1 DNA-binding protein [Escherichia coli]